MHTHTMLWGLVVAAACAAGCTAIVNGKLNNKPAHPDGSVGGLCMTAADCPDGNSCNGDEQCVMGRCAPGTPVAPPPASGGATAVVCDGNRDGTPDGVCVGAECMPTRCGDGVVDSSAMAAEECDDRNTNMMDACDNDCTFACSMDADCNDRDLCNGIEHCGMGGDTGALHVCQPGPRDAADGVLCDLVGGMRGRCLGGMCVP